MQLQMTGLSSRFGGVASRLGVVARFLGGALEKRQRLLVLFAAKFEQLGQVAAARVDGEPQHVRNGLAPGAVEGAGVFAPALRLLRRALRTIARRPQTSLVADRDSRECQKGDE